MKIFPAIDLKDGKCVRLTKGDFEQTLRAHKASNDERKSRERERAITSSAQKIFVPNEGRML